MVLSPAPLGLTGESFGFASVWSEGSYPRGTAEPSRSRYTRARSGPGGGSEKFGGKSLPAAGLANDAESKSAARVAPLAASLERTRIRAIRKIQRWGVRGAPYHPLRRS